MNWFWYSLIAVGFIWGLGSLSLVMLIWLSARIKDEKNGGR